MNTSKALIYQEKFHNILQLHSDPLYVFTYSCNDNYKIACTAVQNKTIIKKALPMESSIFTVEAHAINLAINFILKSKKKKKNSSQTCSLSYYH